MSKIFYSYLGSRESSEDFFGLKLYAQKPIYELREILNLNNILYSKEYFLKGLNRDTARNELYLKGCGFQLATNIFLKRHLERYEGFLFDICIFTNIKIPEEFFSFFQESFKYAFGKDIIYYKSNDKPRQLLLDL